MRRVLCRRIGRNPRTICPKHTTQLLNCLLTCSKMTTTWKTDDEILTGMCYQDSRQEMQHGCSTDRSDPPRGQSVGARPVNGGVAFGTVGNEGRPPWSGAPTAPGASSCLAG